jgi:periplasmic protein CpxP/Spy
MERNKPKNSNNMKRNKVSILAIVALGGLMACGPIANAQDTNTPAAPAAPQRPGPGRGRGIQAILDKLDLTADQKEKVTAAMKEQTDKMMALRNDSSIAQEDRRPKAKEIRDAFTAKLKTILTPEQYTKFEELSKQGMRPPGAPPTAPAAPKAPSTQN